MSSIKYEFDFSYGRSLERIKIFDDGEIEVSPPNQSKYDPLQELVKKYFIDIQSFNNPFIPGVMKKAKILDSKQILQTILVIQKQMRIWIAHPENPVTLSPWFGTGELAIVRGNDSDVLPCLVIQDIATGAQAFYRPRTDHNAIYWHHRPIVDTELVRNWHDWEKYIIESLDDIDIAF